MDNLHKKISQTKERLYFIENLFVFLILFWFLLIAMTVLREHPFDFYLLAVFIFGGLINVAYLFITRRTKKHITGLLKELVSHAN